MKKHTVMIILLLLLIQNVLADIRAPTGGETASFAAVLLVGNYLLNMVIIFIQSKIWLNIPFRKLAIGLAIITPIMFIAESLFTEIYFRIFFDNYGARVGLASFPIIFACYLLISLFYWKLEMKKSVATSVIMAVITNPGTYIFFAYALFG